MLYGITKEPIFCLHGDRLQVYEYTTPADKPYPCSDGKYLVGGDINDVVDVKLLPIHTMAVSERGYGGAHLHTETRIAFTPEFVRKVGGNPVEMKQTISDQQILIRNLHSKIYDLECATELLKSNLSTVSFWKRLKWVFTGVEV